MRLAAEMKMSDEKRELARCRGFDFGVEDHGFAFLFGHFEMECGVQGLGRIMTIEFLKRFLAVFNVARLQQVNGKPCWVTTRKGLIAKIEPLFPREGAAFDIDEYNGELGDD